MCCTLWHLRANASVKSYISIPWQFLLNLPSNLLFCVSSMPYSMEHCWSTMWCRWNITATISAFKLTQTHITNGLKIYKMDLNLPLAHPWGFDFSETSLLNWLKHIHGLLTINCDNSYYPQNFHSRCHEIGNSMLELAFKASPVPKHHSMLCDLHTQHSFKVIVEILVHFSITLCKYLHHLAFKDLSQWS